ncbi:MFS transporter [Micromonospora fulviviridis]|uniref:MFS transporter n=1 Tax=Micromonospora fulviviridis TaxID=47860 RepID=A0ABV2VML4_9ACTN
MSGRLLPAPGPARALALAQLANSVGDGAFLVTSALYFTQVVGLSPGQVGLGLSVGWAVGLLAGVPAGHAADRRDARRVAVGLAAATALAVVAFLLVGGPVGFVLVACLYAGCQTALAAVRQALLARLVEPDRRTGVRARLQSVANAGLGLGAALGGLALWAHTRRGVPVGAPAGRGGLPGHRGAAAAAPRPARPGSPARDGRRSPRRAPRPAVRAAHRAERGAHAVPAAAQPGAAALGGPRRTAAPAWLAAALLVVNTAAVMLAQVRVARRVTDPAGAVRALRRAGAAMVVACALFAVSATAAGPWPAAALLLLGAGAQVYAEMAHGAGAWQLSFDLAPADRHGLYQGFFGAGVPLARMLGPVLLTWLIVDGGAAGWLAFAALYAAAAAGIGPAVRGAGRPSPVPVAAG